MLIRNSIAVTLYDNFSTFCDTGKIVEMKGDLLKKTTNNNYNVDLAIVSDETLMYDFAKKFISM